MLLDVVNLIISNLSRPLPVQDQAPDSGAVMRQLHSDPNEQIVRKKTLCGTGPAPGDAGIVNPIAELLDLSRRALAQQYPGRAQGAGRPVRQGGLLPDRQACELLPRSPQGGVDSFDFKIRKPDQIIKSVMTKLKKYGKGIILMHDFQHGTSEAVPQLLAELKANGYKIVHMTPKAQLDSLAQYDDLLAKDQKVPATGSGRSTSSVVRTIGGE
jgi:hypothetical protein